MKGGFRTACSVIMKYVHGHLLHCKRVRGVSMMNVNAWDRHCTGGSGRRWVGCVGAHRLCVGTLTGNLIQTLDSLISVVKTHESDPEVDILSLGASTEWCSRRRQSSSTRCYVLSRRAQPQIIERARQSVPMPDTQTQIIRKCALQRRAHQN